MKRLYLVATFIFLGCTLAVALDMNTLNLSVLGGGRTPSYINLQPELSWSENAYDYSTHNTGTSTSHTFTLSNTGNDLAEDIQLSATGSAFRIYSGTCGSGFFNLSSNRTCTKKVMFTPAAAQAYSGSIKAVWPNRSDVVATLTGTGTTPAGSDSTPDAFTFTDETGIALSTAKVSNTITVTGIDTTANISVTGDTGYGYKKNGAACTASAGTVVVNDTVNACVTSSGSNSTATTATVTIGGVSDTYSVTTVAGGASKLYSFELNDGDSNVTGLTTKYAEQIVVTGDITVTSLEWLGRYSTTTGNVIVELWTDSSGIPGSVVSGISKTNAISGYLQSTDTWNVATLDTPTALSAGTYHMVIRASGTTPSFFWRKKFNSTYHDLDRDTGSGWGQLDQYRQTYRVNGY